VRDKVTLKANYNGREWQFGLVQREEFIAIPDCPLHSPRVNAIMKILATFPEDLPLSHISIVGGHMTFILRAKKNQYPDGLIAVQNFLHKNSVGLELNQIFGFWINWNPEVGRWITIHKNWEHVAGKKICHHPSGEHYGPGGFGQAHWPLYMQALDEVENFFLTYSPLAYLELYCGIGVALSRWDKKAIDCLGVELSGESLAMVALNAPQAKTLRGTCQQRIPQVDEWYRQKRLSGDVAVFVNPPRLGLEPEVAQWLSQNKPAPLAYMSCSVNTLARDLKILNEQGMQVERLIPYDFFPKTRHIEILALLKQF
jgi:tRNA/tmRNA/rRNA uracil-C5-methylase (TrmA/RlmC/RlmD family)